MSDALFHCSGLDSLSSLQNNIPGEPGLAYPIYAFPPVTGFECNGRVSRMILWQMLLLSLICFQTNGYHCYYYCYCYCFPYSVSRPMDIIVIAIVIVIVIVFLILFPDQWILRGSSLRLPGLPLLWLQHLPFWEYQVSRLFAQK